MQAWSQNKMTLYKSDHKIRWHCTSLSSTSQWKSDHKIRWHCTSLSSTSQCKPDHKIRWHYTSLSSTSQCKSDHKIRWHCTSLFSASQCKSDHKIRCTYYYFFSRLLWLVSHFYLLTMLLHQSKNFLLHVCMFRSLDSKQYVVITLQITTIIFCI
jgi:hypothetical protein